MPLDPASDFDPLIDHPPARYVIGIDLGTTNSAVTFIDTQESPWEIRVLLIPQPISSTETESLDTLPSFYFQPVQAKSFVVGAYARDETAASSGRSIASAKSWLCHPAVDRTAPLLPWHGAEDVKRLSPVEVSAAYLAHIRTAWDAQFEKFPLAEQDIVLTLPASFDEVARELTIQSAAIAGLPRVMLIEEPQAAFYAWVYKHESDWDSRVSVGQKILVCDIGGGTTDFTLIRVRISTAVAEKNAPASPKIQFHRVAVGNHLILGGDNLDLAIAKHIEQKLTKGGSLESYQWDVLVGTSRSIKEKLLSDGGPESVSINLPSRGSKLISGSLQTNVTRDEIRELIVSGFLPTVELSETPQTVQSGFQEFGLPYASDPAITRYLAQFLLAHAEGNTQHDARPDLILFNGGFFASPLLRATVIQQIAAWFQTTHDPSWRPKLLENDRLDLAVARGAAYYGMVRRDQGVRIAATLARSYYLGVGDARAENDDSARAAQAICIMPGSAEPGDTFSLPDREFKLTLAQPVEFSLYVSSVRLADQPGQLITVDRDQLTALPPIRTVIQTLSRNEQRDVSVRLSISLTELGTIDLSVHELETTRSWKLAFDVRATTQTDRTEHLGAGETQGVFDEALWQDCAVTIHEVFGSSATDDPRNLIKRLSEIVGAPREQWPMSLLRRVWGELIELRNGRNQSPQHASRWLNLLGYSLRPGYGLALDDWRVTETWRHVSSSSSASSPSARNELLIVWRRVAGGLTRGQQLAIAEPWLASIRAMAKQMAGQKIKGNPVLLRAEESIEVWRLLGSLELLPVELKIELGQTILQLANKPKLLKARDAMLWALGRLGQRRPLYGPLNTIVPSEQAAIWISQLLKQKSNSRHAQPIDQLALVQMARRTDDRYRDIDSSLRHQVVEWLGLQETAPHLIELVRDGGTLDAEEQGRIFGESLPAGLRLE